VKRSMNLRVSGVTGFPINTIKNAYRFVVAVCALGLRPL